eukprot:2938764-Pleurochrysis_carterae.AAC.2
MMIPGYPKESARMNSTMNVSFPRASSKRETRYYCALSTRVELSTQIPLFHTDTWNRTKIYTQNLCNMQGFAVTVDQKDRQRAKFLDAKMYIQGIATRLGLGPDALADMRGFAIWGDPKMRRRSTSRSPSTSRNASMA